MNNNTNNNNTNTTTFEPFYNFIGEIPDSTLSQAAKEVLIWKKTGLRPTGKETALDTIKKLIVDNLGLNDSSDIIRLAETMILDEVARRYISGFGG